MPHNLSREQIAAAFGISPRTVDRLIAKRQIPHIKIGNRPRFCLEECQEHFQRKRIAHRRAA